MGLTKRKPFNRHLFILNCFIFNELCIFEARYLNCTYLELKPVIEKGSYFENVSELHLSGIETYFTEDQQSGTRNLNCTYLELKLDRPRSIVPNKKSELHLSGIETRVAT